jgi:hypothetical protein
MTMIEINLGVQFIVHVDCKFTKSLLINRVKINRIPDVAGIFSLPRTLHPVRRGGQNAACLQAMDRAL